MIQKRLVNFIKHYVTILSLLLVAYYGIHRYNQSYHETASQLYEITGTAMTMPYRLLIPIDIKSHKNLLDDVQKEINTIFAYVDSTFNSWNPNSEISRLNVWPKESPFYCSTDLFLFLQWVSTIVEKTDGAFNPAVETLQYEWRKTLEQNSVPNEETLLSLMPKALWSTILFNSNDSSLIKKYTETKIDISGCVKGYAVDLMRAHLLHNVLLTSFCIEWGGEIFVEGEHPEKRAWNIGLYNPNDATKNEALAISSGALATSGDYFQTWSTHKPESNQQEFYTHIFAPNETAPLERKDYTITSISVYHPTSCATADALATAIFTKKTEEEAHRAFPEIEPSFPGIKMWLYTR